MQPNRPIQEQGREMQEATGLHSHSVLFWAVFALLRAGVGVACYETGEQGLVGLNNRERKKTCLGEARVF